VTAKLLAMEQQVTEKDQKIASLSFNVSKDMSKINT
jgi:hypothetical protein